MKTPPKPTKRRQTFVLCLLGIAAPAICILVGIWIYPAATATEEPDPANAEPEDVRVYLASDTFGRKPPAERAVYLERLRETGNFPRRPRRRSEAGEDHEPTEAERAEREKLRENIRPARRQMQEERVKKYFELSEDQRVVYLDDMIDRMQERRREWRARREAEGRERDEPEGRGRGRSGPGGRRGPSPERVKRRIETTDPALRAQMAEFRKALHARMAKRRGQPSN